MTSPISSPIRLNANPLEGEKEPWDWWRSEMPICEKWAYFDHAAVGPLSRPAAEAIRRFVQEATLEGDTVWPRWAARVEQLRGAAAELLGAETSEICLVPNTTAGINLVAEGFPWRAGDSVVVPEGEFPSNLLPWKNQRHRGVEVRIVPRREGQVLVDDLLAHANGSTRIIAASWVGYASGYRLDLESLVERAHRRGVLVFLDAIQGLGIYPLDVRQVPVDFLAADGHKWLLGPEGAGIAFIRREQLDQLRCTSVGWNSNRNPHHFNQTELALREDAARFEGGSANMVGLSALGASLEMFLNVRRKFGPDSIARRVISLAEDLDRRLRSLDIPSRLPSDPERRSGIVTFDVPDIEPGVVRKLALDRGVAVSCRDGGVRASLHVYHAPEDLDRLLDALREAISR